MMRKDRRSLISELADDLEPVANPGSVARPSAAWLAINIAIAGILLAALGPFRHDSFQQLLDHPQFLAESLAGMAALIALGLAAFQLAVPACRPTWQVFGLPLGLLGLWLGIHVYGFWHPALEPSTDGIRHTCVYETLLVGIPAMLIGLKMLRDLWPLQRAWNGMLLGLASGAVPALLMQFACMYEPTHIFKYHLLPGLSVGVIGAIAGWFWLQPNYASREQV